MSHLFGHPLSSKILVSDDEELAKHSRLRSWITAVANKQNYDDPVFDIDGFIRDYAMTHASEDPRLAGRANEETARLPVRSRMHGNPDEKPHILIAVLFGNR